MPRARKVITGIAWFRSDQWEMLRTLATDADILEETYERWVAIAKKTIRDFEREGVTARKVPIDVNELKEWCAVQQCPLDASARAAYARVKLINETEGV